MSKSKNIKFTFDIDDWLHANRRASRLLEIESGITPKRKVHKSKKVYNRKTLKKIDELN